MLLEQWEKQMPQANWMLLEWELEQIARQYGWRMDVSELGDKTAVPQRLKPINLTQLAHDLTDRGVSIKKQVVRVDE